MTGPAPPQGDTDSALLKELKELQLRMATLEAVYSMALGLMLCGVESEARDEILTVMRTSLTFKHSGEGTLDDVMKLHLEAQGHALVDDIEVIARSGDQA